MNDVQNVAGPSNFTVSSDQPPVDPERETSVVSDCSLSDGNSTAYLSPKDSNSNGVSDYDDAVSENDIENRRSGNEDPGADRCNHPDPTTQNNEFQVNPGPDEVEEISKIRVWAVETKMTMSHLDGLLSILRERLLPELPACSKTFLRTNDADYVIEEMTDADSLPGEFVYFGVEQGLKACVNPQLHTDNSVLDLDFNIDGVKIKK
ncbi:hypothetical protein QAD02_004828 [Eretmocerus hayati]|uniref:Uncharacterized protein n=1 Tax=Eretmocerus hayati TaxID=131215 RepID=A0ACC2NR16_9HYME|nr:hypothetical protein QAD02_004828 [Eretmocerus hayati]